MIKTFAFLVKKQNIEDQEFHDHWRDPHGSMTAKIPQFVRYAQNHGIGPRCEVPHLPAVPYLGVPVIWTRDLQDLADSATHPERPPLDADGHHFYDVSQLRFMVCEEAGETGRAIAPTDLKAMVFIPSGTVAADELLRMAEREMPALVAANVAQAIEGANEPISAPLGGLVLEAVFLDEATLDHAVAKLQVVLRAIGVKPAGGFLCREELVFNRG